MKRIFALLLAALLALCSCSSKDTPSGKTIRYPLALSPKNLDPQVSDDSASMTVIANLFEGLTRLDTNGDAAPGAAERWETADGGKTVTFHLREDLRWSDGSPLRASDFVYGVRRAVSPDTKSPLATNAFVVKNARQINEGSLDDQQLGVRAADDRTVVFQLEYAYPDFIKAVASGVFLPCQETFFNATKGKYGLDDEAMLTNGPFYLKTWKKDVSMKLLKNPYYQTEAVSPAGVTFALKKTYEDPVTALTEQYTDALPIPLSAVKKAREEGLPVTEMKDTVWGFYCNAQDSVLKNQKIRKALFQAIDPKQFLPYLPEGCEQQLSIFAPACNGENPEEAFRGIFQPDTAKSTLEAGLKELSLKKMPKVTVLCVNDPEVVTLLGYVFQDWQKYCGAYLTLEPLEEQEIIKRLNKGEYQMVLYTLRGGDSSFLSACQTFSSGSLKNIARYQSSAFDSLIQTAQRQEPEAQRQTALALEQTVASQALFYPLYCQTRYFATGEKVVGVDFYPFDRPVSFLHAGRYKKAVPSR